MVKEKAVNKMTWGSDSWKTVAPRLWLIDVCLELRGIFILQGMAGENMWKI